MIFIRLFGDQHAQSMIEKNDASLDATSSSWHRTHRLVAGIAASALVLSACGGGGGGTSTSAEGGTSGTPSGNTATGIDNPTPATVAAAETDVPTTQTDAMRLLNQASFGPTEDSLQAVQTQGAKKYLLTQFVQPVSQYTSGGDDRVSTYVGDFCKDNNIGNNCWRDFYSAQPLTWDFYRNAVSGNDQVRQRVAFALSQIFVISNQGVDSTYGLRDYHQIFLDHAFGNMRDILKKVTLHPVMGDYLSQVNNSKEDPNENFARELLQLFSIGLCELNNDGTLKGGTCQATYDINTVREYAYALTGWTYPVGGKGSYRAKWFNYRYMKGQMVSSADGHDTNERKLVNGVVVPANSTATVALDKVIDSVFQHPNIGPFIGKQLIQFLVTSNPPPNYVARVANAFNSGVSANGNIGSGARGDMKAVIAQILLDPEARGEVPTDPAFGRLREPIHYSIGLMRSLKGVSDGDAFYWWLGNAGQQPFNSPTVFNFYMPDYGLPGVPGKLGPQFGIENENTTFNRMNLVNNLLYWNKMNSDGTCTNKAGASSNVPNAKGSCANLTAFEAYADDVPGLVDKINLFAGLTGLPAADRQLMIDAVNAWTSTNAKTTYKTERVKTAAYLAFTSPYYAIQR